MGFSVFIATDGGGVVRAELRSGSRGSDLTDHDVRTLAVDPSGSGLVLAGTQGNGVWRSEDAGRTWERSGLDAWIVKSIAVSPADPSIVYAGTKPPHAFVSRDRGRTWTELEAFRSIRGRRLWRQPAERPSTAYVQALAASPTDPGVVVAGMEAGAVVRTTDGGETWSNHLAGTCRDCHSLAFHPSDGRWVYEGGGGVRKPGLAVSRDAGATWERPSEGIDRNYGWAVAADPERPDVWYVSLAPGPRQAHGSGQAQAVIYRRVADGPWEPLDGGLGQPVSHMPYALLTDPAEPGHVYAGLANGEVWRSTDRGDRWERLPVDLGGIHRSLVAAA